MALRCLGAVLAAAIAGCAHPATTATLAMAERAPHGCSMEGGARSSDGVPGVAIAHLRASTGRYVGSPSLVVLGDGTYLASHDIFGPARPEPRQTHVYRSRDRGASWVRVSVLENQFWSSLFEHRGDVYIIGTTTGLGHLVIRRSRDGGSTWTESSTILDDGRFHTAPVPVVVYDGWIWRAVEEMVEPVAWPQSLAALLVRAPVGANLLAPRSWVRTSSLAFDQANPGRGWMEGNVVIGPQGEVLNILRVEVQQGAEQAAFLRFDPSQNALVQLSVRDFPGGSKKFTIRFDPRSRRYWTLVNEVRGASAAVPGRIRNRLSLASSRDLRRWAIHVTVLEHADIQRHGFQYADFVFDGDDLAFVSRTAFDDDEGGADDFHNANYLTFHRLSGFRACIGRPLASP